MARHFSTTGKWLTGVKKIIQTASDAEKPPAPTNSESGSGQMSPRSSYARPPPGGPGYGAPTSGPPTNSGYGAPPSGPPTNSGYGAPPSGPPANYGAPPMGAGPPPSGPPPSSGYSSPPQQGYRKNSAGPPSPRMSNAMPMPPQNQGPPQQGYQNQSPRPQQTGPPPAKNQQSMAKLYLFFRLRGTTVNE
jgi:hypothetical protein